MMKENNSPKTPAPEPPYRKVRDKEVQLDGVTYRVRLYVPTKGNGSLESRLLRLMEGALDK